MISLKPLIMVLSVISVAALVVFIVLTLVRVCKMLNSNGSPHSGLLIAMLGALGLSFAVYAIVSAVSQFNLPK